MARHFVPFPTTNIGWKLVGILWMVATSISHHPRNHGCIGIHRRIISPGILEWCRISSFQRSAVVSNNQATYRTYPIGHGARLGVPRGNQVFGGSTAECALKKSHRQLAMAQCTAKKGRGLKAHHQIAAMQAMPMISMEGGCGRCQPCSEPCKAICPVQ